MASKKQTETKEESQSSEPRFDFDKATDSVSKELELNAVNIQRYAFIENSVSSGSLVADLVLGGGYPGGRFIVLVGREGGGKSTLSFMAMREAIKLGTYVMHFDYEGAMDPSYVSRIGLQIDWSQQKKAKQPVMYRCFQPNTGEECFNFMHRLLQQLPDAMPGSGIQAMFVLDSFPSMLPKAIDQDDEVNSMAIQARMFSAEIKKVKTALARKNCILFGINQLREKPGPSYGCLHGETLIRFVDGRVFTIKDIVDKKIDGEVYSLDGDKLIPKKIINWFNNGKSNPEDWVTVKLNGERSGSNGNYSITCTHNHKVMTQRGWVEAKNLELDDSLVSRYSRKFNPGTSAEKFLLGMVVGDCCIPTNAGSYDRGILKLADNLNPEYLKWKVNKLSKFVEFSEYSLREKGNLTQWVSDARIEFDQLVKFIPNRNPVGILERFDITSLALWYMDDGHYDCDDGHNRGSISVKRLKNDPASLARIQDYLSSLGYSCTISKKGGNIRFNVSGFEKFSRDISKYVPPCMQYKLRPEDRGKYVDFDLDGGSEQNVPINIPIRDIQYGLSKRKSRLLGKYDLEVEGSHNYLAGHSVTGVVVHNSPFYETCGNAPRQFSDVRVHINTKSFPPPWKGQVAEESCWDKDGIDRYRYCEFETVKHKMNSPFRKGSARWWFEERGDPGSGLDPVYDSFQYLKMTGQIECLRMQKYIINIPDFPDKGKSLAWKDIKSLVLDPENIKKGEIYLPNMCRKQLESGDGFKLYAKTLGGSKKEVTPEEEAEIKELTENSEEKEDA